MKKLFIAVLLLSLTACTDASMASFAALGNESEVTCYSGGQAVFKDTSTGVVQSGEGGAGVYFESATTRRYIKTYADCIVISK